jgi:hypothetical protein
METLIAPDYGVSCKTGYPDAHKDQIAEGQKP